MAAAIYNVTFHPLSSFPGPHVRGVFYFTDYWDIYTGHAVRKTKDLHEEYGDTVRTSPTSLSYTTSQAWKGMTQTFVYDPTAITLVDTSQISMGTDKASR